MKLISFAWTTPALLAGRKTCTRRDWSDDYARSFKKGELVQAWNKLPRAGGKRIGTIRLTQPPYYEAIALMPDTDYEAEGFQFFAENPHLLPKKSGVVGSTMASFRQWRFQGGFMWVVRFEPVEMMEVRE